MSSDVSCRVAWAADAEAIAGVQIAAWRVQYADVLPAALLEQMAPEPIAEGWRTTLSRPADARNRVLVALEHDAVRGYVLTGPATDPDLDPIACGEIGDLTVVPGSTRQGHGSRLLQAAVDTLTADRFSRAVVWTNTTDDDLRAFFSAAGFAADGAHRTLDLTGDGSIQVKQVRLHTSIGDAPS
ncbi:MAG TPA: GNAT family N-acetyltransferase [Marmoricola sp.]